MKNHEYAPVLIPTLNRFEHFKRCVSSLVKCNNAVNTVLFIALDYPLKDSHWSGYNQICEYIPLISGFKEVIVIKREINFGPGINSDDAINFLFNTYPSIIFSEDDNIFSEDFLDFINKGLAVYEFRKDIFSISGYQYPISLPENYDHDVYIWQGYSGWGVGMWGHKWKKIPWETEKAFNVINRFLKNFKEIYNYNKVANIYVPAKLDMIYQNKIHGDGYICLYLFLKKMYTVFPVISRVRNLGHDGTGINCGFLKNDIYSQQEIYSDTFGQYTMPLDLKPQREMNEFLFKHFKKPIKLKIKTVIKIVLHNVGLWPFRFSVFKKRMLVK
jgi:hypothetical protein